MALGKKTGGRVKGSPNKTTLEIRQAFQLLVENNLENMSEWLSRIAKNDEAKALQLFLEISERILPKLNRTDIDLTSNGKELTQWTFKPKDATKGD